MKAQKMPGDASSRKQEFQKIRTLQTTFTELLVKSS